LRLTQHQGVLQCVVHQPGFEPISQLPTYHAALGYLSPMEFEKRFIDKLNLQN
jgi:hypothetical protein